ncbi:ankyrin repeat domain-containing protein [Flaviaesturariibacter terrae]
MKNFLLALAASLLSLLANAQDKNQQLYKAITQNDSAAVAQLLENGADANYTFGPGGFKMSFLITAINVAKSKGIAELLLRHKADVNWKDGFGSTALMYAASAGNGALVELLLANGADVRASDGQGNTVLTAAKESRNAAVIALIEQKLANQATPSN